MAWKVVSLFGIVLLALSEAHQPISEQKVKIEGIGKKSEHHEEYAWTYPSYEFSYEVLDPHTHDFKGHHETRNGDEVKGYYWLIQPDGLKRTVKYHADKTSGIKTHVDYTKPNHLPSKDSNNEENNNAEENEGNQEENSNQENSSGQENSETNQESNGENESNNNSETSNNESEAENSSNENNNEGNSEANAEEENQEQEGVNMSELEEISRSNNEDSQNRGAEQRGGKNRGRNYMGRRNEGKREQRYRGHIRYHGQNNIYRKNQGGNDNDEGSEGRGNNYDRRWQNLNRRRGGESEGGERQGIWRRGGANIWGQRRRNEELNKEGEGGQNQNNEENEQKNGGEAENSENQEEGNNEEANNNEDNAGQGDQENNNENGEQESANNEEGDAGENQESENGGNEQNNENGNEESSLKSENNDVKRKKIGYHIIIHHPKYISMSKKSKRRI